jgi:signal peptidase II
MAPKNIIRTLLIISIIIVNISCDQVSKKIVRHSILPYEMIEVLNHHLTVTRVENSGAFLSAGDELPRKAKYVFLALIPMIAIFTALVYVFMKPVSKIMLVGLCFAIGGGIGNLFDRIHYGSVTDFLHLKWGMFQTGIFNMADVSIITGMLIIVLHFILRQYYFKAHIE